MNKNPHGGFLGEFRFRLDPSESVEEACEAKKEARRRQTRARRLKAEDLVLAADCGEVS